MVLATGEVVDLEQLLEDRFTQAALAYGQGDPEPLLALGRALGEARGLVARIKALCDDRVRDTLAKRGEKALVAGSYQAITGPGAADYIFVEQLREELIAAGMDQDAADELFELRVKDGRKLNQLANRSDAIAQALAGHTRRGRPGVTYKRVAG